ncbi:hypothetical protein SAMN05216223_106378 [Actinacidiphila yanglinensis]|uniref:Uncharacterized protein n=1 Tax=Actinacidiphila yanglinensis TaxID=310779 RepID=A0A1H6BAV1_9ACTN|nr:hypothetical protein [Actinacidiphila yanglinensis]SEG57973.1 hypothetical protein SAMN05216223_106378 [Actinacidiphila yanglinensis]
MASGSVTGGSVTGAGIGSAAGIGAVAAAGAGGGGAGAAFAGLPVARLGGRLGRAGQMRPIAGFAVLICVTLVLALRLPAGTAVVGLASLGILHNVLELRYMAGRFGGLLKGPFLRMLAALITGIVLVRLLPPSTGTRAVEILLAYVLLAAACCYALRSRPLRLAAALLVVAGAAATSLAFPDYHFVVLTHLHNVVPLVFLWEWSREMPRGRTLFRAVQCGWIVVIPALVLSGAFDGLMGAGSGWTTRLSSSYTPPAWQHTDAGQRFVTVFAFMALMHYLVWVWFMPRYAPDATAAFEQRVPVVTGRWAWALGIGGTAALAVLFVSDYDQGTSLYAAIAGYHAYLEFPVLLMLVLGLAPRITEGEK